MTQQGKNKVQGAMWMTTVVPVALVVTLFILVLPIPTWLLDIFIAGNITLSLVILFSSLYITRPLDFSSFPAILLISTLFRLALNVATTRIVLISGDQGTDAAGEVIQAFGEFVVGGNFAVGCVIFVLISIVNIKVITKGSGRIAEVAARFTLDAMPGKQMAIDSDLNSGLIKEEDAKQRRKDLSMEAEFYGAMDGAAKFVSGDAFASIFITGVNIIGGFFVGIFMHGMDWRSAAETYTLLTIGDGLVSQIPSIIVSIASGLIVARASSGNDLSVELIGQISGSPKALYFTAGVSGIFALVPGLPFIPFMVLTMVFGSVGYFRQQMSAKSSIKPDGTKIKGQSKDSGNLLQGTDSNNKTPKPGSTEEVLGLLGMDTLELEVGFELVGLVEGGDLVERIRSIRRQFAMDYGFVIPPIFIRDNVRLKSNEYRLLLRGSRIGGGELSMRHLLAMDPGTVTTPIRGIATKEPAFGLDALWVSESEKERAQMVGYTVVDLPTVITTHLTELIRAHMFELLGRQETQQLIDTAAKDIPRVVEELIPSVMTVGQVRQVLARLLKEGISIRDIGTILETLADWAGQIRHPEKLTEIVRRSLSRSIMAKFLSAQGNLPLVAISPSSEKLLSESLQQNDEGSFLALEPTVGQVLISRLNKASERFGEMGSTPLILAPSHLRAALAHFVGRYAPIYSVISHYELLPNTKVQSLGIISLGEE
jgi:flagellar biosynthesis protein FlhA